MNDIEKKLNYYRKQCDEMGREIIQLQAEQMRARLEARRSRTVAELVRKIYRLGGGLVEMKHIGQQFLQIILNTLNVDCAIILQYRPEESCFIVQDHLGCRKDLAQRFEPPEFPGPFRFINSKSETIPLYASMQSFIGVPHLLWAMESQSDTALFLGNAIEDQHLHRPFNENDHEIMAAALMVFIDISARIRSEQALLQSEEKYRLLIENASDAIFVLQDELITFHNTRATKILGYSSEKLTNIPFAELIYPDDRAMVMKRHRQMLKGKNPISQYLFRILNHEDKVLWIDLNNVQIKWEGRSATLNFCRDVTKQKQLEIQLRNTHKMEAIGSLAGGIAHDFNNILSAIIGYSELTVLSLPEGSVLHSNMKTILDAGFRAKELVQQILTFSRQHKQEMGAVKLSTIVKEALKLLRPALPSTIDIELHLDSEGCILADATQIHQVVMNLCTNAYHAMQEDGGLLTVRLSEVFLDEDASALYSGLKEGAYLKLGISDTGYGINEASLERIFDPYFTTKEKNKGTGLGLSVVQGIVLSLGGAISVESHPGKGSSFTIFLPKIDTAAAKDEPRTQKSLSRSNERILFVDDEEMLAMIGKQLMEQLGFTVVAHTSAIKALSTFSADPGRFDLVITDLTMPKMTGDRLADEIHRIRPDIPIILCSGRMDKIEQAKADTPWIKAIVLKPVSTQTWVDTISKVLDA